MRAAWLQLAPDIAAWERRPEDGVVSHRSAAALLGLGHLPADRHEFTMPARWQSRRKDVRVHKGALRQGEWTALRGLPTTKPARIAADLLDDGADPEAVAEVIADSLRDALEDPKQMSSVLAPRARRLGFRQGDALAALRWLLELVGDPRTESWVSAARSGDSVQLTPSRLPEAMDPLER